MKTITTDEFGAHALALLDEVTDKQEEVVVTKDGRPVARVVPIERTQRRRTLEELRGSVTIVGDIESPLEDWDVMK